MTACDGCGKPIAALEDTAVLNPDGGPTIFCRVVEIEPAPNSVVVNEFRLVPEGFAPEEGKVIHRCSGFAAVVAQAASLPTLTEEA